MDFWPSCTARVGALFRQAACWRRPAAALCWALALAFPGSTRAEAAGPPAAAAVSPQVSVVSRLPAGMTAAARDGALQLLVKNPADGQPVIVTQLPLVGPTFETLYSGGFLYVARGDAPMLVLDVREPLHPRTVASFDPRGPVTALWGGTGSLFLRRLDGLTLLLDVSDPEHPRYQGVMGSPDGPAGTGLGAPAPEATAAPQQSRLAVSLRPFLFFANRQRSPTSGGALIDFSYQYARLSGLWWGIEIAPFAVNSYYDGIPTLNTRVWFGRAWRSFAVGAALGSGWTGDSAFVQLGPVFRFGRLDRVHSFLRLLFSAWYPLPYPASSEFTLEGPISRRLGLRYNFTQDSALSGFHTALGLQVYLGGDHRWQTRVLTPSIGFVYMRTAGIASTAGTPYTHHPGVIFSLTIEPRW